MQKCSSVIVDFIISLFPALLRGVSREWRRIYSLVIKEIEKEGRKDVYIRREKKVKRNLSLFRTFDSYRINNSCRKNNCKRREKWETKTS